MIKQKRLFTVFFAFSLLLMLVSCTASAPPGVSGEMGLSSTSRSSDHWEESAQPESASLTEDPAAVTFEQATNAGAAERDGAGNDSDSHSPETEGSDGMTAVNITIGNETFAALLYNNEASQTLIGRMPLTLTMSDLNQNEKYYHFSENLHSSPTESPSTIHAGEIMCWSGNSLVLFYDTFFNSYGGYVRMGYLEDVSGLTAAIGPENITVTFSVA